MRKASYDEKKILSALSKQNFENETYLQSLDKDDLCLSTTKNIGWL